MPQGPATVLGPKAPPTAEEVRRSMALHGPAKASPAEALWGIHARAFEAGLYPEAPAAAPAAPHGPPRFGLDNLGENRPAVPGLQVIDEEASY